VFGGCTPERPIVVHVPRGACAYYNYAASRGAECLMSDRGVSEREQKSRIIRRPRNVRSFGFRITMAHAWRKATQTDRGLFVRTGRRAREMADGM